MLADRNMQWFAEITDKQGSDQAQLTLGSLLKTARDVLVGIAGQHQ
jgi:hypothetical protein